LSICRSPDSGSPWEIFMARIIVSAFIAVLIIAAAYFGVLAR
jgi:hypothetical protein